MVEKENDIAAAVPNNTENNVHAEAADPSAPKCAKEIPNNNGKHCAEDLMGLARLFLKEYYTKLSDCPSKAGIFYGDDSHFVHADVEETGRENIQRAIGDMGFEDCKARFYSLKTATLSMQGDNAKLIQVCGELTLVKPAVQKQLPALPRRFVQTIILAHQTPTVLYVKSNVFQWLDTAFLVTVSEKYNAANNAGATVPSPPTTNDVEQPQLPLETPPLQSVDTAVTVEPKTMEQQQPLETPPLQSVDTAVTVEPKTTEQQQPFETPPLQSVDTAVTVEPKTTEQQQPIAVAAASNNVSVQKTKPVESNAAASAIVVGSYAAIAAAARGNVPNNINNNVHTAPRPTAPTPTKEIPLANNINNNAKPIAECPDVVKKPPSSLPPFLNVAPRREWTHRIYFSQLTKPGRFVDFKLGQQELMREIRAITDGVEFVGIKPNSLRREYRTAFGFIDFTTAADMQKVYDACKRDSTTGAFVLDVKIPQFEFYNGLFLSADKTNNLGGGGYK